MLIVKSNWLPAVTVEENVVIVAVMVYVDDVIAQDTAVTLVPADQVRLELNDGKVIEVGN